MQRIKRLFWSVLLIAAVFSGTTAQAAAATTDLPAGMLIGDQDGIVVPVEGDYFIDADDLKAGDVITKRLTIRNTEPYPYSVSMTAEPLEELGPIELLDEVHCTLAMEGTVLYDGRVRGDEGINMILNALDLGEYVSGQQRELMITLTVNPEMRIAYDDSESFLKWHFYAARKVVEEGPNTGDIIKNSLYFILPGFLLTMGILLLIKKRREKKAYGGEDITG